MQKGIYSNPWFVYIAECKDKTLYTGIALDVEKRVKVHNTTNKCNYTRFRKPISLVYREVCVNHHLALKREQEIKSFRRNKKLELIRNWRGGRVVECARLESV